MGDNNSGFGLSRTAKDLLSGTTGGIAQVLVGQPLDRIKVNLQTAPQGTYTGMVDCASKLVKRDGVRGLYAGTLMPLLGVGACVSVQFSVVEAVKRSFASSNAKRAGATSSEALSGVGAKAYPLSSAQLYSAGVAAGLANSFLAAPIEHIRIRLQLQTDGAFRGPVGCAKAIVSSNGVPGLFRGLVPTLVREGHGMGMYFLIYEAVVGYKLRKDNLSRAELPSLWAMLGGATSGPLLWLAVYPVDVLKTVWTTQPLDPAQRKYSSLAACAKSIYAQGGWRGFFRGLGPTLTRAPISNAATFVAYEWAARNLEGYVRE